MPRATIRRIVLLALAGGILVDVVVPGNALGVNAPLVVAALLAAAYAVAGRDGLRRLDPADAWLAPAAVVLAGMAAIRTDAWLVGADLWFSLLLAVGAIGTLAGGRITRGAVPRVLELSVGLMAVTIGGAIAILGALAARRSPGPAAPGAASGGGVAPVSVPPPAGPGRLERLRPLVPVIRGLLVAVPIVGVFAILFASADAVFARFASDLLAWQVDLDLQDALERSVIVASVAWVWAGLFAFGGGLLPALVSSDAAPGPPPASAAGRPRRLGSVEAATILVALDLLFAAFVALQLAYLFGGLDTLATAGLTYAEYARRGFFELVEVAVLVVALVVALDLGAGRRSRVQLGASLALLALTAAVLVSAFVRLRLYQDAYGWTELRFVVMVAIGWLAVALAIVAGLLLARRTAWTLHALGILLLVTLGGMNVVGPQAFVAERNLERVLDPSRVPAGGRTGLDADYLELLGDEAVPPVVAAFDRLPDVDRERLARVLAWRASELRTSPELQDWPAWNLSRERARQALAAWEARRTDALVR
ncbi:MAG: DUF4153 domain-containing protein [Candidatus Limnocylindrales bacterium]